MIEEFDNLYNNTKLLFFLFREKRTVHYEKQNVKMDLGKTHMISSEDKKVCYLEMTDMKKKEHKKSHRLKTKFR